MVALNQNYAHVQVENEPVKVIIPISTHKPEIPEEIQKKWQKIVDLVAHILQVPTGLITKLTTTDLEILIASRSAGNPYHKNDKDKLGIGMFCETVAGRREQMMVRDIDDSDYWKNNPHVPFGMRSYLGVPIQWEDGELFGTFCMLDDKANRFSEEFQDMMCQFKDVIETDLKYMYLQQQMQEKLSARELQLREAHHRIKNHFNFLIGFLRIQSRGLHDDHEIQTVLKELENRIQTISLIHEELQKTVECNSIPLDNYIKRICNYVLQNMIDKKVEIKYDIVPIILTPENTMSCGFLLSELVTNSLKHAFRGTKDPVIQIEVIQPEKGELKIDYRDNGIGLPENYNVDRSSSTGSILISSMIMQMKGRMETIPCEGAHFNIFLKTK